MAPTREVAAGTLARDVVRSIGARLLRAADRRQGGRRGPGPDDAAARGRRVPRPHREGSEVARRAASLRRAHPGDRGAPAAPGREDRLRSGDRRRLLLRLRGRRAVHARGSRGVRGRDAEGRRRRSFRSCARRSIAARRTSASPTIRSSSSGIDDLGDRRGHLDVHRRAVHRPVPRPARARHVVPQALQAAQHRGRVLARRREAPDAAAHLRARRCSRRKTSTRTCIASRRRSSATIACSGKAARPVHVPSVRAGRRRSGPSAARSLYNALDEYMRERQRDDFHEIKTPLLFNKGLWENSGHWGKYRENMFLVLDNETGEHDISLKPMNCPSHYLLYSSKKHSYRELPLRYVTFDVLHRNEVTGALSGLTRVRQFSAGRLPRLPDARIRSPSEVQLPHATSSSATTRRSGSRRRSSSRRVREVRDRRPTRCGIAPRRALRAALEATGMAVRAQGGRRRVLRPEDRLRRAPTRSVARGSSAPSSSTTRRRSGSTCTYVGEDNTTHRPVVIHRAVSGSLERFIAILDRAFRRRVPGVARAGAGARAADLGRPGAGARRRSTKRMRRAGIRAHARRAQRDAQVSHRRGRADEDAVHGVIGKREAEADRSRSTCAGPAKEQKPAPVAVDEFIARVMARSRRAGARPAVW